MKKLVLVRHAKAIEPLAEITDSERSLKIKGIKDAHKAAKKLYVFNIKPEMVISSPAYRALETALIFAEELDFPKKKIKLTESIYFDYTTGDFVEMIQKQDNKFDTILIVGHNPKISEMASQFTHDFHEELPTCGVAVIEFSEKKWKKINLREGKLSLYIFPDKETITVSENFQPDNLPANKQNKQSKAKQKNKQKPKNQAITKNIKASSENIKKKPIALKSSKIANTIAKKVAKPQNKSKLIKK